MQNSRECPAKICCSLQAIIAQAMTPVAHKKCPILGINQDSKSMFWDSDDDSAQKNFNLYVQDGQVGSESSDDSFLHNAAYTSIYLWVNQSQILYQTYIVCSKQECSEYRDDKHAYQVICQSIQDDYYLYFALFRERSLLFLLYPDPLLR